MNSEVSCKDPECDRARQQKERRLKSSNEPLKPFQQIPVIVCAKCGKRDGVLEYDDQ